MPVLSAPHRLARQYSSRSLLAAAASRIAAEVLADSRDGGTIPEELINRYAMVFKRWIVEAIESATLPTSRQWRSDNDDDDAA